MSHTNKYGSAWNRWDLHVHTPDSIHHGFGTGEDCWENYIKALEALPKEIKVLGINDYIFISGYRKVLEEKKNGRLENIELILPVIELRLDRFGGSRNSLSKVNYHVIFADESLLNPDLIEHQFLNAIQNHYILTPEHQRISDDGEWASIPTRESLEELGRKIINSVPEEERKKFQSPLVEGFNNLCFKQDEIEKVLAKPIFRGKKLTAVGKTEWADIKWTDQSIAEKKNIINRVDFVFTASNSSDDFQRARKSLDDAGVNSRLFDCSDAHTFASAGEAEKDRLGNVLTWIKGDLVFESLRQASFEYAFRVRVDKNPPLIPFHSIDQISINFPDDTKLESEGSKHPFCFRGEYEISFSPFLTCIIGGRGAGKSTLLNLIHEKILPKQNQFFRENKLVSEKNDIAIGDSVIIDGDSVHAEVEFLQQNEIEQLASDPTRFTSAIISRLKKLDSKDVLEDIEIEIDVESVGLETLQERLVELDSLSKSIAVKEKELATNKKLIASFESEEYQGVRVLLGDTSRSLQELRSSKKRLDEFVTDIRKTIRTRVSGFEDSMTPYDLVLNAAATNIEAVMRKSIEDPSLIKADIAIPELEEEMEVLKGKLNAFLEGRGLSQENMSDVGRASERVAQIEQELPSDRRRHQKLVDDVTCFSFEDSYPSSYKARIEELLDPINQRLSDQSDQVRSVKLEYEFDRDAAREFLVEKLAWRLRKDVSLTFRSDHISTSLSEVDFFVLEKRDDLLAAIKKNTKTGQALHDYFSEELNFLIFLQDSRRAYISVKDFRRVRVSYDGRPLEHSSFGQRCTAAIIVLVLLGNTPIIIDEPEAHLDSTLIAKYLVNLVKTKKQERQIIFATHNANFVINGDSELVHILSVDGANPSNIFSTTIENLEHREHLLALEGGEDAFMKREARYGIANSNKSR